MNGSEIRTWKPQVAPASFVGARCPLGREDLRERGDKETTSRPGSFVGAQCPLGREDLRERGDTIRLKSIIDGKYDRPATWAQNLLCFHYGICRPPLTGGDDHELRSMHITSSNQAEKPVSSLLIRPNPANTWVVFEYQLPSEVDNAYIRVVGMDGRELTRIPITAPEGQPVYDTRTVSKGTYTIELVNGGRTVDTGKLVVE